MKRLFLLSACIICFLLLSGQCIQQVYADTDDNPRLYNNMKIILISRIFNAIDIKGDHDKEEGFGFDQKIYLNNSDFPRILGLLVIYNESSTAEKNIHGGWIHTTMEIHNFSGFMKNQNNKRHVFLVGNCEYIKLTAYRG